MIWIFVSYSMQQEGGGSDHGAAERVERCLRHAGYEVFRATAIAGGTDWKQEVQQQIRACDAVVIVHSERSARSRWCLAEWLLAESEGKLLFPVTVDDTPLAPELGHRQTTPCRDVDCPLVSALEKAGLDPGRDSWSVERWRALRLLSSPTSAEGAARLVISGGTRADRSALLFEQILPALEASGRTHASWEGRADAGTPDVLWADDLERQLDGDARSTRRLGALPPGAAFVATTATHFEPKLRQLLASAARSLVDESVTDGVPRDAWRVMQVGQVSRRRVEQLVLQGALSRRKQVDEGLLAKLKNEFPDARAAPLLEDLVGALADVSRGKTITLRDYDVFGGIGQMLGQYWEKVAHAHRPAAVRVLFKLAFSELDGTIVGRRLAGDAFDSRAEKDALSELETHSLVVVHADRVAAVHDLVFDAIPDVRSAVAKHDRILHARGFR